MRHETPNLDTVHVNVEYFDGLEEGDVGYPYYVGSCVEISGATDGKTVEELMHNVREMVEMMWEYLYEGSDFPKIILLLPIPDHA